MVVDKELVLSEIVTRVCGLCESPARAARRYGINFCQFHLGSPHSAIYENPLEWIGYSRQTLDQDMIRILR